MHVRELLHTLLSESSIHRRRLNVFFEGCDSLLENNKLTVTGLGRGIKTGVQKFNINKMNRLVGNEYLYNDRKTIYSYLSRHFIGSKRKVVILIDWSSLTPGERFQTLRATLACIGRPALLYEEVHELSQYNSVNVHNQFLENLKEILPVDCCPVIVTDAGFCVNWFKKITSLGWDFVGRISNTSNYWDKHQNKGKIRDLLSYNSTQIKNLGLITLTKVHQFECYLQVYKKKKKNRVNRTINGERSARSVSVQAATRESQPWIIVSSVGGTVNKAKQVMSLYSLRMQIELSFRDLKSHQFGMGLRDSRSQGIVRLSNLLLIAFVVSYMTWLIGLCAKNKNMHYQLQANSIRTKNILSVTFIAKEIVKMKLDQFSKKEWEQAVLLLCELIKHIEEEKK